MRGTQRTVGGWVGALDASCALGSQQTLFIRSLTAIQSTSLDAYLPAHHDEHGWVRVTHLAVRRAGVGVGWWGCGAHGHLPQLCALHDADDDHQIAYHTRNTYPQHHILQDFVLCRGNFFRGGGGRTRLVDIDFRSAGERHAENQDEGRSTPHRGSTPRQFELNWFRLHRSRSQTTPTLWLCVCVRVCVCVWVYRLVEHQQRPRTTPQRAPREHQTLFSTFWRGAGRVAVNHTTVLVGPVAVAPAVAGGAQTGGDWVWQGHHPPQHPSDG